MDHGAVDLLPLLFALVLPDCSTPRSLVLYRSGAVTRPVCALIRVPAARCVLECRRAISNAVGANEIVVQREVCS